MWRDAWTCDCDGVDRDEVANAASGGVRAHLTVIETITGVRPTTCPWRAFSDPIVREVRVLSSFADDGNLAAVITEDTPAAVVDGLGIYLAARAATIAEERKYAEEERERIRQLNAAKG